MPARSFDVVRTERVLMYVPDLHRALDALLRLLAPGGRARALRARLRGDDPGALAARRARRAACGASCWTARCRSRAPAASSRGCWPSAASATSSREPYTFAVDEPVWRRIVYATLAPLADPELLAYLDEAAQAPLKAAFTGILTVASVV